MEINSPQNQLLVSVPLPQQIQTGGRQQQPQQATPVDQSQQQPQQQQNPFRSANIAPVVFLPHQE